MHRLYRIEMYGRLPSADESSQTLPASSGQCQLRRHARDCGHRTADAALRCKVTTTAAIIASTPIFSASDPTVIA